MSRKVKNIILISTMIIMMICSYFTVNKINNGVITKISDNQKEVINSKRKTKNDTNEQNIEKSTDKSTTDDSKKNKGNKLPSTSKKSFSKNYSINKTDNTLYIILFSLESMIFACSGLYILLLNTNNLKEGKK